MVADATSRFRRWLFAVWACALGACLLWEANYELTRGDAGTTPVVWPGVPDLPELPTAGAMLVIAVHPKCPCTAATLTELERLRNEIAGHAKVYALVCIPDGPGYDDWRHAPTVERAAKLPDARVIEDIDGRIAARFGMKTSGHIALYGTDGHLLFSGGVTAARGQTGENPFETRMLEALRGQSVESDAVTPVFGCEVVCPCSSKAVADEGLP